MRWSSPATATKDLAMAVAAGILQPLGQRRARRYLAGERLYTRSLELSVSRSRVAGPQVIPSLALSRPVWVQRPGIWREPLCLFLSLDLSGDASGVVGHRAKKNSALLDLRQEYA